MIPKIKICGITNPTEAEYLKECNVEYAGIVMYYEKSKRNNTIESAKAIMKALSTPYQIGDEVSNRRIIPTIKKVAVTVSPTIQQVSTIEEIGFDMIQIHGELSAEVLENTSIPIIRAMNVSTEISVEEYLKEPKIQGILFDGKVPGSGKTFDWSKIQELDRHGKLLILAGGINSHNVVEGIRQVNPDIVDVSSSVEYVADGIGCVKMGKDPDRIKIFVEKVRTEKEN